MSKIFDKKENHLVPKNFKSSGMWQTNEDLTAALVGAPSTRIEDNISVKLANLKKRVIISTTLSIDCRTPNHASG